MTVLDDLIDARMDTGRWLIEHRQELDRGEAVWLTVLADFDAAGAWAADGQLSCVDWLVWRTGMARSTAYEKLRIATQLRKRPIVAAAFAAGTISYCAVRAIARAIDPTPEVDEMFVHLATTRPVADVERAVHLYRLYQDQERPPRPEARRGLRLVDNGDGTATLTATLTTVEAAELAAALRAFIHTDPDPNDADYARAESTAPDPNDADYARADDAEPDPPDENYARAESARRGWAARQADALIEMARTGLTHAHDGHATGADRYLVHLVHRDGHTGTVDGTPISAETAARVLCDCSTVCHHTGADDEPLNLGRRQRQWSQAQRRAITVRDRGRCRFPGCHRQQVDIHHLVPWHHGGPTDVDNGILCCPAHHTLLHAGYTTSGDANRLTVYRPDGTPLRSGSVRSD